MQTSTTLQYLTATTTLLGTQLRYFARNVCPRYNTRELPREEAARARRRAKQAARKEGNAPSSRAKTASGPLRKVFSLITYKLHALGDYVTHILRFGTTDSYSTQTVRFTLVDATLFPTDTVVLL